MGESGHATPGSNRSRRAELRCRDRRKKERRPGARAPSLREVERERLASQLQARPDAAEPRRSPRRADARAERTATALDRSRRRRVPTAPAKRSLLLQGRGDAVPTARWSTHSSLLYRPAQSPHPSGPAPLLPPRGVSRARSSLTSGAWAGVKGRTSPMQERSGRTWRPSRRSEGRRRRGGECPRCSA